jgi:hypothetical protein
MWPLPVRQWARADSISLSAIATPEAREPGPLVTRDGLRSCSGRAPASRHPPRAIHGFRSCSQSGPTRTPVALWLHADMYPANVLVADGTLTSAVPPVWM